MLTVSHFDVSIPKSNVALPQITNAVAAPIKFSELEWRQIRSDLLPPYETVFILVTRKNPPIPVPTFEPVHVARITPELAAFRVSEARRTVSAGIHACDTASNHGVEASLLKLLLNLKETFTTGELSAQLHLKRSLLNLLPATLIEARKTLCDYETNLLALDLKIKDLKADEIATISATSEQLTIGGKKLLELSKHSTMLGNLLDPDEKSLTAFKEASVVAYKLAPKGIATMTSQLVRYFMEVYGDTQASKDHIRTKVVTLLGSWDNQFALDVQAQLIKSDR